MDYRTCFSRASRLALVVFLLTTSAFSQSYHTRAYTEEDGLPGPDALGLAQDHNGCIWVTSRTGVGCYDGASWRRFGAEDGLVGLDARAVEIDDSGVPWVATHQVPVLLFRFGGERWELLSGQAGSPGTDQTSCMAVAGGGAETDVLIGTHEGALYFRSSGLDSWSNVEFPVKNAPIGAVEYVRDRFLILCGGRLFEFRPRLSKNVRELASPVDDLRTLCWDAASDQLFYIGRNEVFVQVGDAPAEHWVDHKLDSGLEDEEILASTLGPGGVLYFGNHAGVCSLDRDGELSVLNTSSGLVSGGTTAFLRDREDNVWIGSYRGVTKIISRRFENYNRMHGLYQSEVTAVVEGLDGVMILGHPDGVTMMEDAPRHFPLGNGRERARVLDLDQASDGTVWASASWIGLVEIHINGQMTVHGPEQGLALPVISTLLAKDGTHWVATGDGMYRRTEQGFEFVEELRSSGPRNHYMRSLSEDSNGRIFGGTGGRGVVSWNTDLSLVESRPEPGSPGASTYTVCPEVDGETWVGSAVGLMILEGDKLRRSENPAIDRSIYFIEHGANGDVWIGANNGVYRWNGGVLKHFTVQHGLSGSEANRAGGLLDSRGRFWIGTNGGVSIYDEQSDIQRAHLPTVEVLGCDHPQSETRDPEDELTLRHSENQITFHYRAIAFADESRVRFQTMLEGWDEGWSEPHLDPLRQTTYRQLPPGDFKFKVRAIDVEGRMSEPAQWETIHIQQPIWNETWFRVVALLVVVAILSTAISAVNQSRNATRLELKVAARTRELSESQAATERERARLELTLANIADGVAATSGTGEVLLWNRAAHGITGWSCEEAIGKPIADVLGEGALEALSDLRLPHVIQVRTGESRHIDIASVKTARSSTLPAGRVIVFRDVTDKLAIDRERAREEKLEALGLLAGGIAHDFNNLLTVIIANLSLPIPDAMASSLLAESLQDANAAANRARLLTLQLSTFSKGGEPVLQAASIAEMLKETASFMFSGSSVLCTIDAPEELWLVDIDQGQMGQVVHNLMLNAREAMPKGGMVRVRARNLGAAPSFLTEGRYILIEFEDEGVGVSGEDLAHIFDPYFSTKSRGSGLGLAIAYSVVQRHGGHVTVDSAIGEGTTFRVFLPASEQAVAERLSLETLVPSTCDARVLVMDDEEPILRVVQNILGALGYEVTCVKNGDEAVAQYARSMKSGKPFDAVIMDLTIPGGMGGKEAIQRLKRLDPDVRAIVASGYSNDPVMARAEEFGFCAEIAKPFGAEELTRALESVLAGQV